MDSGASMHMISKKDLKDAEMDTLTTSKSPTTVITANSEVQTHEEAIRIQCNTENFVPIVVPGLSTSSSSSFHSSTSMTPSRQEIDSSDHHPAIESSEIKDRQARRAVHI